MGSFGQKLAKSEKPEGPERAKALLAAGSVSD